jgi:hypothetical protein
MPCVGAIIACAAGCTGTAINSECDSLQLLNELAGTTGLEPAASAVTGQRSNQLNYVPNLFPTSLPEPVAFLVFVACQLRSPNQRESPACRTSVPALCLNCSRPNSAAYRTASSRFPAAPVRRSHCLGKSSFVGQRFFSGWDLLDFKHGWCVVQDSNLRPPACKHCFHEESTV